MPTTKPGSTASSRFPDDQQLQKQILEILDENYLMSVATIRSDGWPHVTLVNYLRHGHGLFFVIARESQKHANITRDSRISIAIGGSGGRSAAARGLSMAARAAEVMEPYRIEEINKLIYSLPKEAGFTPHPSSSLVAVMEARPQIVSVIDYSVPPGRRDLVRVVDEWSVKRLADET